MNTRTPFARLLLAVATLILIPLGFRVLGSALAEPVPHLMVMMIFSGSLAALAGLVAGLGFFASLGPEPGPADVQPKEEDQC